MKTTVSEAEHPLLCEGTRREKGDLALALMITYKDDQSKLKKVSLPLKGGIEMQSKPWLCFDGLQSFPSEHKSLCHALMICRHVVSFYILLLRQNLTARYALPWKRHSYQTFLKLQLRDAFTWLLKQGFCPRVSSMLCICYMGISSVLLQHFVVFLISHSIYKFNPPVP